MSFEKSNLLDTPQVRKAYEFVNRRLERKLRPLVVKGFTRHFQEQEYAVNNAPDLSEEDKKAHLDQMKKEKEMIMAPNSVHFEKAMEANMDAFSKQPANRQPLESAAALSHMTEGDVETMVTAALLYGSVVTPMDYKDARNEFGDDVVELLEEVKEARVYREETELDTLSANAQAIMLMDEIRGYRSLAKVLDQLEPGQKMQIYPTEYVDTVKANQSVFGRNSQLDALYEEAFNGLQNKLGTGISMNMEDGEAKLSTNGKVENFMLVGPDAPDPKDPNGPGSQGPKDPKDPNDDPKPNGPKPNGPKKGGGGDIKLF